MSRSTVTVIVHCDRCNPSSRRSVVFTANEDVDAGLNSQGWSVGKTQDVCWECVSKGKKAA